MELRQLQCFVECAKTKSFSKAAAALFTSQSNVSKTIAALENELGNKLFIRKQHGIELTANGKRVYEHAIELLKCSEKILDCVEEEEREELKVSFQSGPWFARVFRKYYQQYGGMSKRYRMTSASLGEIIRRISGDQDQLGFGYVEEEQMEKLKDLFRANHLGYYVLRKTSSVLYCGEDTKTEEMDILPLIQGPEDAYLGLTPRRSIPSADQEEQHQGRKVVITTNSDCLMQEMIRNTQLCNISPRSLSQEFGIKCIEEDGENGQTQTVLYICIFRNDRILENEPKQFLGFVRNSMRE